ncbi:acid ceramidase-like [Macrosteles quadrilineatus]|uniref:acid ceramidase-like n=1 Tax=Macrosteles quadrilineatus TaxID=74068 RepID=UPI0023E2D62C|nr:acid ceramidase-like [Macrosteles quadrilineatus]
MAPNYRLIQYLFIIVLCLQKNQIVGSSHDVNNKSKSHIRYFIDQYFINNSRAKMITNIEVEADDFIKQIREITNTIPETNNIYDLTQAASVGITYNKFQQFWNDELSQAYTLKQTLKNVEKLLDKGRQKRLKKLANQAFTFGNPFQGCSKDPYPSSGSKTIKTFKVNLDAEPEERWKEVVQQNSAQIKKLADFFEQKLGPNVMSVIDTSLIWLHRSLPSEYYRELNGLSLASGISVARVTLYNVFYEFFTFCTSIVMEAENGNMYHGRNLDFGLFMGWDANNHTWFITEILRPLIIKIDFVKNGKPLYSAVTYAGYTGILTGVKKNSFSLSIDERFMLDGGYVGLAEWILGIRDSSWLGLLTRRVMESASTYKEAQQMLTHTPLVAPVYFILAGTSQQGSIITRGRRDADVWPLGSRHKQQNGSWFLVQTNYDHWKGTPFFDHRRQHAVQCMDEIGQQKPLETLYRVLSTRPILNKETTLTAVMDVKEGLLEVWERDCKDPCWPF